MNVNKVCEIADLADPTLVDIVRELLPHGPSVRALASSMEGLTRQDWEEAMPMLGLHRLGALRRDALVLVVSAGTTDGAFYLTRHVRQVFVTERYLGELSATRAFPTMLVAPSLLALGEFEASRLVTQHMDPRVLRFPDETFDAVVSWGWETLAGLVHRDDVANAAYEMGRVLKPGGVMAVSMQLLLGGPPGGAGSDAPRPYSADELRRYVVEASGLEPVDELDLAIPGDALAATRHADRSDVGHRGYVVGSVQLTLRRTSAYPLAPNLWAKPAEEMRQAVELAHLRLLTFGQAVADVDDMVPAGREDDDAKEPEAPESWPEFRRATAARSMSTAADRDLAVGQLTTLVDGSTACSLHLDALSQSHTGVEALLGSLARLRETTAVRPHHAPMPDARCVAPVEGAVDRSGWRTCNTLLATGKEIRVVVDSSSDDPVSAAFLAGGEGPYEHQLVGLMLDLVKPGDVVLDLGAHVGTFSLSAAAEGCTVVAVEASTSNAALLRASAAANRFRSLRVVTAAAGELGGSVEFFAHGPWGHVVDAGGEGPRVSVPSVSVDDLLAELVIPGVAFVKMDIEGSEIVAIRGMRRLLDHPNAPPVLYESNGHTLGFSGATPQDLVRELSQFGYTSYMAEPPRLIRTTADDWQPQTLVNYLAFKQQPEALRGWRSEPGLAPAERISRALAECQDSNPDQRAYIARALQRAPDWIISNLAVTDALARLRSDLVPAVRDAARWSSAG